jgi:hypothetical protein
MLSQFGGPLEGIEETADPLDMLWAYVDFGLYGLADGSVPPVEGAVDVQSGRPYVELRSQGTYDEAYRDRFTEMDDSMCDRLASVIERGIDQGVFRDVDADQTAEFLVTVMLGGLFRRATADGVGVDAIRAELETIVQDRLLAES